MGMAAGEAQAPALPTWVVWSFAASAVGPQPKWEGRAPAKTVKRRQSGLPDGRRGAQPAPPLLAPPGPLPPSAAVQRVPPEQLAMPPCSEKADWRICRRRGPQRSAARRCRLRCWPCVHMLTPWLVLRPGRRTIALAPATALAAARVAGLGAAVLKGAAFQAAARQAAVVRVHPGRGHPRPGVARGWCGGCRSAACRGTPRPPGCPLRRRPWNRAARCRPHAPQPQRRQRPGQPAIQDVRR
mmetsp:Transcript_14107/g.42556  ORF Transcript_14107/g.42556 Transcript_14107/m.42556 type:complete len:241 (+) Transcript_14107:483-1205(+)